MESETIFTRLFSNKIQLLLLWCLVATIMLPSIIHFSPVALIFCLSTFSLFKENVADLWRRSRIVWVGFSLFVLTGIMFSQLPEKSIKGGYDIIRHLFLFAFITPLITKSTDKDIAKSIGYFASIIGLIFFLVVLSVQLTEETLFIRGSNIGYTIWGSHNLLSTGVTVFFILTLSSIATKNIPIKFSAFPLLFLAYCMVFILSRGNLVAAGGIGLFLLFYYFSLSYKYLLVLLSTLLLVYFYLFFILYCEDNSCPHSLFPRQYIYQSTLSYIYEKPIFGYGFSVFKIISGIQENGINVVMPHNLSLDLMYSVGLFGAAAWVITIFTWFYNSGWTFSKINSRNKLPLPIIIAISLFIYLFIRGLFDLKLVSSQTFGLLAVIFAFIYSRKPTDEMNEL